jgi:hypothetical protein
MSAMVLDPLPYQIEVDSLLATLHIREGSPQADAVLRLAEEAKQCARPKAIYKVAYIEGRGDDFVVTEEIRFSSRVLRVNLDGLQRFFPWVVTSGCELEAWANTDKDVLVRFYADAINQVVLQSAVDSFRRRLCRMYGLTEVSTMNPGSLTDWPLGEQRGLFTLLGDVTDAIGVTLTDSLLMVPTKTASGIFFPTEETFTSCQLCPRANCPNRRAPYDAELFERTYAEASA